MKKVIPAVLDQHLGEAAMLWNCRWGAVHAPHFRLGDLIELDQRLVANLEALRIASEGGWRVLNGDLTRGDPDEHFPGAFLAFESGDPERIRDVMEAASEKPEALLGIISALGWLEWPQAQSHVRNLLVSESALDRRAGLAASAVHRQDPGQALLDALQDEDLPLKARALKAVGELGRRDLMEHLARSFDSEDASCRFFAAWSAAILGDARAAEVLKPFAAARGPFQEKAVQVAMRRMELRIALLWCSELAGSPESLIAAVVGAGVLGDPANVPWLLEQMAVPVLARKAGESFEMITGVDLAEEDLEGQPPEGFETGPNDDPEDENVGMDPDDYLSWPDPSMIEAWWAGNRSRFTPGIRYLAGRPIDEDGLKETLKHGRQRQRSAAALERAMRTQGGVLFETRAPGFRQIESLSSSDTPPDHPGCGPLEEDWKAQMVRQHYASQGKTL